MSSKLTILFAPFEGVGHVMACIGLAEALQSRGHKIVFAVNKVYEGKLALYGFQEELLDPPKTDQVENFVEKPGEAYTNSLMNSGMFKSMSSLEKLKLVKTVMNNPEMLAKVKAVEPQIKQIVDKHKPDVYIIDHFIGSPTLIYSDKPWVFAFSTNPFFIIDDERTPPGCSG